MVVCFSFAFSLAELFEKAIERERESGIEWDIDISDVFIQEDDVGFAREWWILAVMANEYSRWLQP